MASVVLTDAYISIGGNVLSSRGISVALDYSAELLDETAFGDTTRTRLGGLKDWTLTLSMHEDYAASQLDSILFPLVGTLVALELRPTSGAVSTSNPKYTGNGVFGSYPALVGGVGELVKTDIKFEAAGTLTRATA